MRGYPKFLNTKEDVLYVTSNFPKEEWRADLEGLLSTQKDWFFVADLPNEAAGVTDATHKVVSNEGMGADQPVTYAQYELRDNPQARIFQLGFTEAEIRALLAK